jgi:hypothetical protein
LVSIVAPFDTHEFMPIADEIEIAIKGIEVRESFLENMAESVFRIFQPPSTPNLL